MASKYKLTYLNARSQGEPIRFLLEYAGADWEDHRIEKGPQLQAVAPFGKVPLLEVDGKQVHQSVAICRYLARQFELAGDSAWEELQIDMVVETIRDMREAFKQTSDENKEESAKKREIFVQETIPFYLSKLEPIVERNGGHFVNCKLTWADFYWAHMATAFTNHLDDASAAAVTSKFPALAALQRKVFELPAIKAWVARRPQSGH